ncbi:hypothetical protein HKD37_08G023994 [Glycine soja]
MEEKKEREKEGEHEIEGGKEGGEIYSELTNLINIEKKKEEDEREPLRLPLLRDDQIFDSNVILNFCIVPWRLKTRLSNCLLISNMNFRVSQIYREVNTCDKIASFAISVQDFFRSDGSIHQFISEDFCKNRIGPRKNENHNRLFCKDFDKSKNKQEYIAKSS